MLSDVTPGTVVMPRFAMEQLAIFAQRGGTLSGKVAALCEMAQRQPIRLLLFKVTKTREGRAQCRGATSFFRK